MPADGEDEYLYEVRCANTTFVRIVPLSLLSILHAKVDAHLVGSWDCRSWFHENCGLVRRAEDSMSKACRVLLGAVSLLLTSCGTYVPDIQEFWGTPDDAKHR